MKIKNIVILLSLLFGLIGGRQIGYTQTVVTGSLSTRIDSLTSAMPSGIGTNDYVAPTSPQLTTWGTVITKILQADYSGANTTASGLGYHITQFNDNTTSPQVTYYILEKNSGGTNHWGYFFFNPAPRRPKVIIETPHDLYDLNTAKQGRQIFMKTGARTLFVNGTHRCNSALYTTCSGTTTVCSDSSEKYRSSDQAHNITGTFQKTTEILKANIVNVVVIQPHGFSKDTGDPDVIMSNGTRSTPSTDYLVTLRNNLQTLDATLTFKVAHVDLTWTKLVATENTQGRYINGSGNPCSNSASSANGRFLHIEQAYTKLRDSETNRKKLSDAIALTFPADTLRVTSPNGGESWQAGSTHSITWAYTGFVDTVKIEYTLDNGSTWKTISSTAPNTGTYSWTLPNAGAWRARVRISDLRNSVTSDVSNSKFTIVFIAWPISNTTTPDPIASAFGPRMLSGVYDFHRGFDLPNVLNTPVHPVKAGVIVRMEDTSVTAGGGLERYGNWILVQHESVSGEPRHTGYLHLNGFHHYVVGDTVSTSDTIAFMGKSGVGINTIHTHLEYYKNLSGTSINKDKIYNPLEVLPYTDGNAYVVSTSHSGDSTAVEVNIPTTELDFDEITMYGTGGSRTVAFNSRTGINPSDNDNPSYNNVYIDPAPFTIDSTIKHIRFWTKLGQVGDLDSIQIKDINGYSATFVEYSGQRYAVVSGNWDNAIWASSLSGTAGEVPPPSQYDDVMLKAGVTVIVNTATPECRSISFEDATAHITMNATGTLNVYGNFTIASTTHNVFTSWATGGKLRFAGALKQTLNGWSTASSATANTTLMEVIVDKTGDTLKTPHTDMKLSIGTSLEILNGNFLLDSTDDITGKNFDGSAAATPTITVESNGAFLMKGGPSAIRSGSTDTLPIGKFTIRGKATLTSNSTLRINFGGLDVESGGILTITTGWSTGKFNPGVLTVKNGGMISNSTTTNPWYSTSSVVLQNGGVFKTTSSTTTFPVLFTNQGTVRYGRTASGDQTVTDMNYYRLEISISGNNKVWTLTVPRTIADSLEINNSAALVFSASSAQALNLNGTLRLTSGTINNSNANVTLTLANGALISRATGILTAAPVFGATVNVRYSSTLTSVTTGPEIPVSASVLKDVTIICDTATVSLGSAMTINGTLTLSNGILDNSSQVLTFANGANIRRATGTISSTPIFSGDVDVAYINSVASVTTGSELPTTLTGLDTLSIESAMNVTLGSAATVNGALKFSRGMLFLGDNDLTLAGFASITGTPADTTMVVINGSGSFIKSIASIPMSFTFPVGDTVNGRNYSPAVINLTSGTPLSGASIGVRVLNTKHPSNPGSNDYLNRYWIMDENNISNPMCNVTFHYDNEDVHGNEGSLVLGQWDGDSWATYGSADTLNNTLTGSVSEFSDFTGISSQQVASVMSGWNLLSVPVDAANMERTFIFPNSVSSAYAFQAGYVAEETLQHGVGYWLKFTNAEEIILSGSPVVNETVNVNAGWNIIGSLSTPVPVNTLSTQGTTIQSNVFGYNRAYTVADTLKPGKGYWIKVSSSGKIILGATFGSMQSKSNIRGILSHSDLSKLNKLTVTDAQGRKAVLFFGKEINGIENYIPDISQFDMPPVPPDDGACSMFDVRYSSNRFVELLNSETKKNIPLSIHACNNLYPMTLSWEIHDRTSEAKLLVGKKELPMAENGKMLLSHAEDLCIKLTTARELPKEILLSRNYPNPFNPVTTIQYGLPDAGTGNAMHVQLKIYNVFGQEVATLVNEVQNAGYHIAEWNAAQVASGIYYYRLQAGETIIMHNMILLK